MRHAVCRLIVAPLIVLSAAAPGIAQSAIDEETQEIRTKLDQLQRTLGALRSNPQAERRLADVEVYAKAGEWIVRHAEFFRPEYAAWTQETLDAGLSRASALAAGAVDWEGSSGCRILAYRSAVDESVQPYALTLPADFGKEPERRWPLHLVLHGRNAQLTEVSFIHGAAGKPPAADQDWIQLDVFGRTNNAYRFAGESDVLEALADVQHRYRIDERRIVLHGFSMGGAGSWHLGLHYPSRWCSVGPGAGFVDFYKYQKVNTPLPAYQDRALHIYDSIDYVLNAFNVPVCTYGGELDRQLVASTQMVAAAEERGVPIKLLIGPGVEHKFHPETQKEFMAFHHKRQVAGRPGWSDVRHLRFSTHTLKYNTCEWLTIEEQIEPYHESVVEARVDDDTGRLVVKTTNVALLRLDRDVADEVELDGIRLPLRSAAEGLLPNVLYEGGPDSWSVVGYQASLGFPRNADLRKRHNLQGPIDDAFMQPFVCVRGTGVPWNAAHAEWVNWTLDRFTSEFDKWFRGRVSVINDTDVTAEIFQAKNLILFGDPGSNSVLAQVVPRLPVQWTKQSITVNGQSYDPGEHGVALLYPNPLNPRRYVVVNSGHTFHREDFEKSNAWLFPRLGDIALERFVRQEAGGYREEVLWAEIFDSHWKLPPAAK
jgi:dienelactone hydrolase